MFQGQLMALSAALLSAIGSSLYNKMGERLTSDMIGYVRMFIAVPLALVLVFIFDKVLPLGYSWQTYLVAFLSGFIGYFLCDYFMFKAIVGLGARETSVVMTLNPVMTAVMSLLLFDERLASIQVVGMSVTVIGVFLMVLGENGASKRTGGTAIRLGLVCAFAGAVFQSMADVTAKAALSSIPSVSTNMLRLVGGLVAWIIFGFIRRRDYKEQFKVFNNRIYILMMVCAVAAGPVLGMALSLGAMERIPVGVVRSLVQTSPVFLVLIDVIIRRKRISWLSLLGTLVSVAGVALLF